MRIIVSGQYPRQARRCSKLSGNVYTLLWSNGKSGDSGEWGRLLFETGNDLVADGRNKNGTGSVPETVFTELLNRAEILERKRCVFWKLIMTIYGLTRSRICPHVRLGDTMMRYPVHLLWISRILDLLLSIADNNKFWHDKTSNFMSIPC